MADDLYGKTGGTWKIPDSVYVKQSGTWEDVAAVYRKEAGVWRKHWPNDVTTGWGGSPGSAPVQTGWSNGYAPWGGWTPFATAEIPAGVRNNNVAHIVGIDLRYAHLYWGDGDDNLGWYPIRYGMRVRYVTEGAMTAVGAVMGAVTEVGPFTIMTNGASGGNGTANMPLNYSIPADYFLVGVRGRSYKAGAGDDDFGSNTAGYQLYFRIAQPTVGTLTELPAGSPSSTGVDTRTSCCQNSEAIHNPASDDVEPGTAISEVDLRTSVTFCGNDDNICISQVLCERELQFTAKQLGV